jgi:hypothetical protein
VRTVPGGDLLQAYDPSDVRVEDGFYLALWRVRDALAMTSPSVTTVRVTVFGEDLGGATVAEHCPDTGWCLLGHFDAAIRKSRNARTGGDVLDLTRAQTLPVRVFLQGPGFRPTRLGDLVRLSDGLSFEDPAVRSGNCVVTEFTGVGAGYNAVGAGYNAVGAGYNAVGAVGGLTLLGPDSLGSSGLRVLHPTEAGELARSLAYDGGPWVDAALLVVDDFGDDFEIDDEAGGLLSPGAALGEDELRSLITGGGFSHGALVLHQVVQMVEAAGFVEIAEPWGPEFRVFARGVWGENEGGEPQLLETTGDYLIVAAVDTLGFDTDVIAGRIGNALAALRYYSELNPEDALDLRRAAINMSFTIVPCAVFEDLEGFNVEGGFDIGTALPEFGDYVAALAAENGVANNFYAELSALLIEPTGSTDEPLLGQIESCTDEFEYYGALAAPLGSTFPIKSVPPHPFVIDPDSDEGFVADWRTAVEYPQEFGELLLGTSWPCSDATAIYVASSGNFGLGYAMYPAAWPLVVSVSSQNAIESDAFSATKSFFSNSGDVMAPGLFYELGRSSEDDPELVIAYAGTSFSAPVVSLFTALDLMLEWPACAWSPATSKLTFATENANQEVSSAVFQHCYSSD